jgi:hypothetical protein
VAERHRLADGREDEAGAVEALHPERQGEALAGDGLGAGELAEAVGPWMRPKPDSPTPPQGSDGTPAKVSTELTLAMPERTARAMRSARRPANTAAPRP